MDDSQRARSAGLEVFYRTLVRHLLALLPKDTVLGLSAHVEGAVVGIRAELKSEGAIHGVNDGLKVLEDLVAERLNRD